MLTGRTEAKKSHSYGSPGVPPGLWPRALVNRLVPLGLGLWLATGLVGCGRLGLSSSADEAAAAAMGNQFVDRSVRGSSLVSKMLPVRLRLRRGWQAAPAKTLHPSADLQAYNPGQEIYLLVLGESNTSVAPGNLEDQASRYVQLLKGGFQQVISNEARTSVERVSNFPAVQYEVRGEVLGKSVAYLHTTVQMDDHYYQVVVWTPNDLHAANAEEMRAIVQEFGPEQQ
ncbi:MAG TPA: hypothetical protein IGR64_08145 [Leptolyngbyaceae cyanobacterium M65_K2018_010]|nr:hypothetical protein [Leptolyngbyaceae cyanobacterium M65_K2018_010]